MSILTIASNQTTNLSISIENSTDVAIQTAARELAHFLKRITGADFAITSNSDEVAIRLSIAPLLAEESYHILLNSAGLSITGGDSRGVIYGIYGFLEDVLGVRFFTHDVTKVPKCETLLLEELDITGSPAFEYRYCDYGMPSEWRARNRMNAGISRIHGGSKNYALFVHSFYTLVPPKQYFDSHPEYFSMVNGRRTCHRSQLCLTNPEVIEITIERAKQYLRQNPDATLISISQNDCYNPCECPECARIDAENSSHSGSLLHFVNAVAAGIEEEFPHVVVDTLAYQYTRKPPKVLKPRHNVCVRLCSIECCFGHPMSTCNHVASFGKIAKTSDSTFQDDLIGWGKICNRVYIWDYVTNFAHYWLPFPNFHVIGPNMRFFAENNVKGVFEEGNMHSVSPDMTEMRTWLLAKLLWNPEFDVEQGIFEFTEAVYGPAAAEIRAYINLLETRVSEGNIHFGIYEFPFVRYLDPETLCKAQTLLAAACEKQLTLSQRVYVEKVALSVEYAIVSQNVLMGHKDLDRLDAMFEKARTLGINRVSEWLDWDAFKRIFLDWDPTKSVVENLANVASFADITPLLDVENVINL